MAESKIEWTDYTFNPWWGCTEVSPACDHCYARKFAKRTGLQWGKDAQRRFFSDKHWAEPLRWNAKAEREGQRLKVFCGSMCDILEDRFELANPRLRLSELIAATPFLDWLLLTKRPQNFGRLLPDLPENVWRMTTVESPEYYWRIDALRTHRNTIYGLSMEPLLADCPNIPLDGISWVIVGGESGPGARPMHPDWARGVRDQCQAAGVPFFFKQWGQFRPMEGFDEAVGHPFVNLNDVSMACVGKKSAGRLLDGREWSEYPA